MSDSAARTAPTVAQADWLQLLPPAPRYILQGRAAALHAAAAALSLADEGRACRAVGNDRCAMLWLGPDERLIIAARGDGAIAGQLGAALAGTPHSLVDVSHRQVALRVTGPFAAEVLNCGCPQDLALEQFPVGMCTRTLFGKAEIVLWRRGPDDFHVEVWRSFADYVSRWLLEASQDLHTG